MDEAQWDAVIAVHLKGHCRGAAPRRRVLEGAVQGGEQPNAAVINTASASGVTLPNAGQANYGAAKAGIAALTLVAAEELERYGVRVNAIAPIARTRLTLATPGMGAIFSAAVEEGEFDCFSPANISPLVAYLATREVPADREGVRRAGRGDLDSCRLARRPAPSRPTAHGRSTTSRRGCPPEPEGTITMIDWSETDLLIRDAMREFIDKEIRPHLDALESGDMPPYPIIRKLFSQFGIDVMAGEAVKTMLDRQRMKESGSDDATEVKAERGLGGIGRAGLDGGDRRRRTGRRQPGHRGRASA